MYSLSHKLSEADIGGKAANRKNHHSHGMMVFLGGHEGDRTLDLTDANRTLSQLSYTPVFNCLSIITQISFL